MPQSVYKVTTDNGEYNVTVDDTTESHVASAPNDTSIGGDALWQNVENLGKGAVKEMARVGQMIPGMTTLTDKMFDLPPGTSEQSTQPSNTGQTVGGLAADAAISGAAGAADTAMVYTRNALGQMTKAPYMGTQAGRAAQAIGDVSAGAVQAAKASLIGKGPVTAAKLGAAIGKYGANAVKLAVGAEIWKQLVK